MNQPTRSFPKWVYIVLPLCMSLLAAGLIAKVQQITDDFRTTQIDVARIQAFIFQLHSIEAEAIAERRVSAVMAQTKEQLNQQAEAALKVLHQAHPHSVVLERVQTAYSAYATAFDVELPFLVIGNTQKAEIIAAAQLYPAYASLKQSLTQANTYYNNQAKNKNRQSDIGTTLLLACGSLCLGVFILRVANTQRAEALHQAQSVEEERTRAVLETALDAIISMDAQGSVIGWNAQAEKIFGWSKAEVTGRPLADIIVPEELRESYRRDLTRYLADETEQYIGMRDETEVLHRNGHLFPIALSLSCVRVGGRLTFNAFICDISERKEAEARLQQSEERYRSVVEQVKDVIFTTDVAGNWTFLNPAWTTITGFTIAESMGINFLYTAYEEDRAHSILVFEAMRQRQKSYDSYEMRCKCKTGEMRWIEVQVHSTFDAAGILTGFFGTICDNTERRLAEERLEHQALHDALTGLPNRLLFQDRLGSALRRMPYQKTGVAVLFIDLDNFKFVNDSMGHEAGDILLQMVAQRLQASARRGDTVARLGGDEFTLLLENLISVEDATQTAERIIAQLQQPIVLGAQQAFASASIGIAFSDQEGLEEEDLMRDADTAMYQAKTHGKSGFVVFDPSMNADVVERVEIETGLRFAVERGELRVYYQPLIDLSTGCMNGVEALVRWEHPTRGLMAPGKFIPAAEESGLIIPIGYWVLEEACRQMQTWKAEYPHYGEFTVNVNLSGKQLQRPDVVERVRVILEKTQITPGNVKLEITESVMMVDVEGTVAKLHALKALGVKLAMDDFGTGYSSMASLNLFPLDTVKIDREFIKRLTNHQESESVVAAIIMLSKALKFDVTGEGVETAEQLSQLQCLGCDIGQGYFFAKPLPATDLGNGMSAGPHHFAQTIEPPDKAASSTKIEGKETVEQYLRAA